MRPSASVVSEGNACPSEARQSTEGILTSRPGVHKQQAPQAFRELNLSSASARGADPTLVRLGDNKHNDMTLLREPPGSISMALHQTPSYLDLKSAASLVTDRRRESGSFPPPPRVREGLTSQQIHRGTSSATSNHSRRRQGNNSARLVDISTLKAPLASEAQLTKRAWACRTLQRSTR